MAISEASRHAMFVQLESVLGQEVAATLMEDLPPVGWADVATKRDLDQLRSLMQCDVALAVAGLGTELRAEMHELGTGLTRTLIFTVLGSTATVGALTISASRLA